MTLASQYQSKTPDRPGTKPKELNRGSVSDTLPPTLLRLPDLAPVEPESVAPEPSPQESISPQEPAPEEAAGQEACDREPYRSELGGAAESSGHRESDGAKGLDSTPTETNPPSSEPETDPRFDSHRMEAAKAFDTEVHQNAVPTTGVAVTQHQRIPRPAESEQGTRDDINEDSTSSVLLHFASRKSLVALLLLIAGLAIFLPRSSETGITAPGTEAVLSEQPEQSDGHPPSPLSTAENPSNELADAAPSTDSVDPPHTKNAAAAGTADLTPSEVAPPQATTNSMIQQPAGEEAPRVAAPRDRSLEPPIVSMPPVPNDLKNTLPDFPDEVPASVTSAVTDTPDFNPASLDAAATNLAEAANAEIRRMDAARASARPPRDSNSITQVNRPASSQDEKPAFRHSRTPHPITDWVSYLPDPNATSVVTENTNNPQASGQSSGEQLRSTGMPGEPDFRFALPGETASGSPHQENGSASQSAPSNPASVTPGARVARPPNEPGDLETNR